MLIPEEIVEGLKVLVSLTPDELSEIVEELKVTTPTIEPLQVALPIASVLTSRTPEEVIELTDALISLPSGRALFELSAEQFAEKLVEALAAHEDEELHPGKEGAEILRETIVRLLEVDSLQVASKALNVLKQFEHRLCSARVVTDIRPIFGATTETIPGAAIVHTLRISYHEANDDLRDIFVSMNTLGLDHLQQIIERAKAKAACLERFLSKAGVPNVD